MFSLSQARIPAYFRRQPDLTILPLSDALPHAAEALLKRTLTFKEVKQLRKYFDAAAGSTYERSQAALAKFTGLSPEEMKQRADDWRGSKQLTPQTLKWMV